MACNIIRNTEGKIIKVLEQLSNKESKIFNEIAKFPHVENLEQAVDIYNEILKSGKSFTSIEEVKDFSFNKWKGKNRLVSQSDIADINIGEEVVVKVYHGTTNEFYVFDSEVKGNIEGHLGKINYFTSDFQDASTNYQSEGADITGRIENLSESLEQDLVNEYGNMLDAASAKELSDRYDIEFAIDEDMGDVSRKIAEKELLGKDEKVLELYVKLNNPVVLGHNTTWVETIPKELYEDSLEDAVEEIAEEYSITKEEAKEDYSWEIENRAMETEGVENPFIEAMQKALDVNGYDTNAADILGDVAYDSEVSLSSLEKDIRKYELHDNYKGDLASSQVIADFFENLGYDGIILNDVSERFSNMGIGEGTSHVHVFDKYNNQIKLSDGRNITFAENTNNIFYKLEIESDNIKYKSFKQALEKTDSNFINIISNGVVVANIPTTLDENTTEGLINALILDNVIQEEKYIYNGETYFQVTGEGLVAQRATLEFFKDTARGLSDTTQITIIDGNLIQINKKEKSKKINSTQEKVTTSIIESVTKKVVISEKEKISEKNLRLNLFKVLSDMKITVASLKEYKTKFKLKNNKEISVEGLADIANRIVAFKGVETEDGKLDKNSIALEDLTEEVMHIIVETLTDAEIQELSEFIKSSPEYQEHYKLYNEIYKGDQKRLEKEILGKIMKNLTLGKTEGHPKSFLGRLVEIIEQFFDKLGITNKHYQQLKQLNSLVEKFVIEQTETFKPSDIQDANKQYNMFSLSEQVQAVSDKLVNTFSSLKGKKQFSSFKRQLNVNLENSSKQELGIVISKIIESTGKLLDSTESATKEASAKREGLSSENLGMLNYLVDIKSLLSSLRADLRTIKESELPGKNRLDEKLEEQISDIEYLASAQPKVGTEQVRAIAEDVYSELGEMESDIAKEHLEKAIAGQVNDVNFIFSFFGQLHHSSNPSLKLLGNRIHKMFGDADTNMAKTLYTLQNFMESNNLNKEDLNSLFKENGDILSSLNMEKFREDLSNIELEVYNKFAKNKVTTIQEYKRLQREQELEIQDFEEELFGKYNSLMRDRVGEITEKMMNPRYYNDLYNIDGSIKEEKDRKGVFDKYKRLGISFETITFLRELSSSRASIKNEYRKEEGRIVLSPKGKEELNSISKTRKTQKSTYSDITGLKRGLDIVFTEVKEGVPLVTGGWLVLDLSKTKNKLEETSAKIAYDLHKLDHDYVKNSNKKEEGSIDSNFINYVKSILINNNEQEAIDFIKTNLIVSLSQEFYKVEGESLLQNPELIILNPGKEKEIELLRSTFAKRSSLLSVYRNTTSPIEIDKMHKSDMEIIRQYTSRINDLMKGLKLPKKEESTKGENNINRTYKNSLKNKNIQEGSQEELTFLIESHHSNTEGITKLKNAYERSERGVFLTTSENDLLIRYKGHTLLETELNFARQKLHSYYTRYAPINYKSIEERFDSGEDILDVLLNLSEDKNINIRVDSSFSNDSDIIKMNTFSEISGQKFGNPSDGVLTQLEDFNNKEKNGTLIKLSDKKQKEYEYILYDNGYLLNINYNHDFEGGKMQPKVDKYTNSEFDSFFGINKKGEATKNEKIFDLRKLVLTIKKQAYEEMDSKGYDLLKPIQISKTKTQKIREIIGEKESLKNKWGSVIELVKETLAYRVDDLAYGEKDYEKSKLLPKFYVKDLEDPNDVSTDHFMALVQLVAKSSEYKAKKEALPGIEAIQNLLLTNKKNNRGNDLKNVIKMTESYIDSVIYGKIEQLTYKVKIPNTNFEVDLAKIARVFTKFVMLKNLGFSIPIALTGLTTGYITKKVEEIVGEKVNTEAAIIASKKFKELRIETALNSLKAQDIDQSELYLIMQTFGEYNVIDKARNAKYGPGQKHLSKSAMALHAGADFPISGKVVLTVLYDNKFIKGKRYNRLQYYQEQERAGITKAVYKAEWTKEEDFVYNYMNFTKEGFSWKESTKELFKDISDTETAKILSKTKLFIRTNVSNHLSIVKGQIPQQMRVTAQRHAIGTMAMLHKGFVSIILQNKFKDRTINYDTGQYEEGHYRTIGRLVGSLLGNPLKIGDRKEDYKEFFRKPEEKDFIKNGELNKTAYYEAHLDYELKIRNTRRVAKEMGGFMALGLIFSMLFAGFDDDDLEDIWLIQMSDYILHRTLNEAGTNLSIGIIGDVYDTIKEPMGTHLSAIEVLRFWDLFDNEKIKYNKYKGLSKRQRYVTKNVIGVKAIYDMHNANTLGEVVKSYEKYNNEGMNWATLGLYDFLNNKKTGILVD